MGSIGMNPGLVETPNVDNGIPSTLVSYHQGSLSGALSAMAIVAKHEVIVVVISKPLSLNDCLNWVIQLLLEEILDSPIRNDYILLSKESAEKSLE